MKTTAPVGLDSKIEEALRAVRSGKPTLLYGPSGTGKTIVAWQLASTISAELKNRVMYLQLYPEVTKNVIIGGETIKNGNIVVEVGPILKIGGVNTKAGATFIIDECTHATEPALLGFNSLIEAPFQTVVGAEVYELHENTRFIFAGNTPDHEGNVALPQSFANRLYILDFPVPPRGVLENIVATVAGIKTDGPDGQIQNFVVDIAEKVRSKDFCLSPRNLINCMLMLKEVKGTGFSDAGKQLTQVNANFVRALRTLDMDPFKVRNIILATLLGNTVMKNNGPDKVKALLWE
jgi:MoxR-like ATPase